MSAQLKFAGASHRSKVLIFKKNERSLLKVNIQQTLYQKQHFFYKTFWLTENFQKNQVNLFLFFVILRKFKYVVLETWTSFFLNTPK